MNKRELQKEWERTGKIQRIVNVLIIVLALLFIGWVLFGCTPY